MYTLIQGSESVERVDLLFELTKITSVETKNAVKCHLCQGRSEKDAAYIHDVALSNLSRALVKLNQVASIVEKIKESDWRNIKS